LATAAASSHGFTDGTMMALEDTTMQPTLERSMSAVRLRRSAHERRVDGKQYVALRCGPEPGSRSASTVNTPELQEQRNQTMRSCRAVDGIRCAGPRGGDCLGRGGPCGSPRAAGKWAFRCTRKWAPTRGAPYLLIVEARGAFEMSGGLAQVPRIEAALAGLRR